MAERIGGIFGYRILMMSMLETHTFRSIGFPWRLYAGENALQRLGDEVRRQKAQRAFVVCGQTVAHRTNLLPRVQASLGNLYAGVFDAMGKDSTWPDVQQASQAARAAGADLLIAIGGGSVIVGTRVVAILLGETGDPYDMMTQYVEGKAAVSPRLMAPKPPIINVVTTPTTAMNRGGSGLKNDDLDHRMEFYDPKTRPVALFWDAEALLTAPPTLIRSTATTTYSGCIRSLGNQANPLVEGDRLQALRLLQRALPRVINEPDNAALRIDLCTAAFLLNRAADDDVGRRTERDEASSNAYALATAIHIRYHHVGQGEATSAVTPGVTRLTPPRQAARAARIAEALEVWQPGMSAEAATAATADALATFYASIGMPRRVRDLDIPQDDLPQLAEDTRKNFNARPGVRTDEEIEAMLQLLKAIW
jgi:alcohol dehydrogenase class IV